MRNPNPIPYPGTPEAIAAGCTCREEADEGAITIGDCFACKVHEAVGFEANDLLDAVETQILETLLRARADPNGYPCGAWRNETLARQIARIEGHVAKLAVGDTSEPHLAHIITRAAIAAALSEPKQEER